LCPCLAFSRRFMGSTRRLTNEQDVFLLRHYEGVLRHGDHSQAGCAGGDAATTLLRRRLFRVIHSAIQRAHVRTAVNRFPAAAADSQVHDYLVNLRRFPTIIAFVSSRLEFLACHARDLISTQRSNGRANLASDNQQFCSVCPPVGFD